MDLGEHQLFVATVDAGSITAAAAALGLSRPTLSRRLAALEARLGLALLHRSTRSLTLTPAGRRLYERVKPLIDDVARAEAQLLEERDEVSGPLTISAPPVLAPELSVVLVRLQRLHPRLRVSLTTSVRWVDLRAEGIDVAIRAGRLEDPDLVHRRLGHGDVSAVASPRYLDARGAPTLETLSAHALLLGAAPEGGPQRWWPRRDGERVPVEGGFHCDDQAGLLAAALADAGVAMLSELTAAPHLESGGLVRVLPETLGTRIAVHAVFTRRTLQPARVRVLVDAVARWFAEREL
ncbi:MAG: LysR substrate-binding domain-containing protein [Myxococcota bacterium]|nr:LysR substrate-binding domain-containing protein [Myxococcota bacterium]